MRLPQQELWVIDWVVCGQGDSVSREKLEELMVWKNLRERVWRAQIAAELVTKNSSQPADAELELNPEECEQLLAILPLTFRWGTGEDVGFSLKRRLAYQLWGNEEYDKHEVSESAGVLLASLRKE